MVMIRVILFRILKIVQVAWHMVGAHLMKKVDHQCLRCPSKCILFFLICNDKALLKDAQTY